MKYLGYTSRSFIRSAVYSSDIAVLLMLIDEIVNNNLYLLVCININFLSTQGDPVAYLCT